MTYFVAIAIGATLMLLGFYTLKALDPPMQVRVGLGAALFVAGAIAFWVTPGVSKLIESPVLFGLSIACLGLGINQLAAPLRRALGKAA